MGCRAPRAGGSADDDGSMRCAVVLPPCALPAGSNISTPPKKHNTQLKGKLSKHIVDLPVGAALDFKGPIPKYDVSAPNKHTHIGMVAGGSGLTPMLQVAEELLRRPGEKTKLSLIFANQSEADIILKVRVLVCVLGSTLAWSYHPSLARTTHTHARTPK